MAKVKFTLEKAMKARRGEEIQLYSLSNLSARWWLVVHVTPQPLYPWEKYPLPVVWEAGWARSGWMWKISHPLGFDLHPVQPVVSHHSDIITILVTYYHIPTNALIISFII
jgi:hypothetical protein